MSLSNWIFLIIFIIAITFFAWSFRKRFRLLALGKAENRSGSVLKRCWNVVIYPFLQRCAINPAYRFGINHAILFWCFMVLLISNAEFLLKGIFSAIDFARLPNGAYFTLSLIFDIVSILALLAVILAVVRRLFFAPRYLPARSKDAFVILSMIAALMLAFFFMNGAEIGQGIERASSYMPISGFFASAFMNGASKTTLDILSAIFWWIHAIVLLSFLNYLPYSKHMHILTSIPNVYLRNLDGVSLQPREEFKKGNAYGVGQVNQFTSKNLMDSYSCTECGRCSDMCPANATQKHLNPRVVIHDIKVNLLKNGPDLVAGKQATLPLIGGKKEGSIEEEVLWDCTTCGACTAVCPVFIEQYPRILDIRRHLVQMESRFPEELLNFFENMESRSNPWGIAPTDRAKWTTTVQTKPFEINETEYLFYVGCFGSFDARSKQITLANARIFNAAGISWGILGKDELCCGDSLRRLGNEFIFDTMAQKNVKMFKDKGVKKIITQCPHCYTTLKNDYRQYGLEVEVIHHTELIDLLIKSGKLKIDGKVDLGKVVFHDACYLGRYNQIYDAPRKTVALVTGKSPVEMERNHERSFCCGAGGGRMWLEEKVGKGINIERVEQALTKEPQTICVSCPYCMTMFEDGLKTKKMDDKVQVLDVAEIVNRALKQS